MNTDFFKTMRFLFVVLAFVFTVNKIQDYAVKRNQLEYRGR